jgi:hypothetical protein
MQPAARKRLGDIVVERRMITEEQLAVALAKQEATGLKLGEVLVELNMITRIALAGVISAQWDDLGLTTGARKNAETEARKLELLESEERQSSPSVSSVVEVALRERLESLTAELAARDARIAQQDATISALLARQTAA